jgi:hypothetical protein
VQGGGGHISAQRLVAGGLVVLGWAMMQVGELRSAHAADRFTLDGELRQEIAYRYVDPPSFTKIAFVGLVSLRYDPSPAFGMFGSVRGFYDAVYDMESIDSVVMRRNPRTLLPTTLTSEEIDALSVDNVQRAEIVRREVELRELYADWRRSRWDLRVGRQIVRWNVLEGSRVVDEINPLDFREFILPPVTERMIPLPMLRLDYYPSDWTVEAIWILKQEYHKPAPKGSEWEQLENLDNLETSAWTLDNTEWALKVSGNVGTWGLSLSYLDHWDDFPTAFRTVEGLGQFGTAPEVVFHPSATRLHTVGTTLTNSFGPVVFNAEAAYVLGKYFGLTLPPFDPVTGQFVGATEAQLLTGEVQRDFIKYALGVDARLWKTDWSLQIQQEIIPNYVEEIVQDQVSTLLGLYGRHEIRYGALTLEMLALYFINERGSLVRPRATFRLTDHFKVAVGADLFRGTIGGPLPGEFNFAGFFVNHDRIYVELTYSF